MISVDEAFALLQENAPQPRTEKCSLADAYGRYLSQDIHAPEPSSRYTNSAMDGFAVRWVDVAPAAADTPVSLKIVGESRAGEPFDGMPGEKEAIRINTGAMLPDGADTVVRVEDTREQDTVVEILAVRQSGQDVRYAGEEFGKGDLLLQAGTRLGTRQTALLATVGISRISVFIPPAVATLVTGSELVVNVEARDIAPHQIRDSNTIMLMNAVRDCNGRIIDCRQVEDDFDATVLAIEDALACGPDIILCSGGVSVGRHDHVKEASIRAGFKEIFWRIRQKPGKPLFAARRDNVLLFGLPGNPVSAFMCFTHYICPLFGYLLGQPFGHSSITARAGEEIINRGKRTDFMRVALCRERGEIPGITKVGRQGSHMLSSIVHADGYIKLEPGQRLERDDLVQVFLL